MKETHIYLRLPAAFTKNSYDQFIILILVLSSQPIEWSFSSQWVGQKPECHPWICPFPHSYFHRTTPFRLLKTDSFPSSPEHFPSMGPHLLSYDSMQLNDSKLPDRNRHFTEENNQMANKPMQSSLTSITIREM